jgi:tetratricopeptide (TPR) repeat protein
MSKNAWKPFPHPSKEYTYAGAALKKNWGRLHLNDKEPFPENKNVQEAWRRYHAGDFEGAMEMSLSAGVEGYNAANKVAAIYAHYIETDETAKLTLYEAIIKRVEEAIAADPKNITAHYQRAHAMGRYSQRIPIAEALSRGFGGKIKESLNATLKLAPDHVDAHIAFGAFHAEIISKVGAFLGGATYGASKDAGIEHYTAAIKLNPESAIAKIEYAKGLLMLYGNKKTDEATQLYVEASESTPADAMERLDVESAKSQLENE